MALQIEVNKKDPKILVLSWDGCPWRELSKSLFFNELRKFPLDLSREEFLSRFSLLEEKIGKRYAVYLLSQRALLSSDLEERLIAKGLSLAAAKSTVQSCIEKGYIDDSKETSRLIAKELKKGMSARAVFFKLKAKKGIDQNLLRQHMEQNVSSDEGALDLWIQKNAKKIDRENRLEMQKLMAKLCRKGFSPELVFKRLSPKYTRSFDDI